MSQENKMFFKLPATTKNCGALGENVTKNICCSRRKSVLKSEMKSISLWSSQMENLLTKKCQVPGFGSIWERKEETSDNKNLYYKIIMELAVNF